MAHKEEEKVEVANIQGIQVQKRRPVKKKVEEKVFNITRKVGDDA